MLPTRLQRIDDLVRELSFQDDPDRLIRVFSTHSGMLVRRDGVVTVSRREMQQPDYRILRSWRWRHAFNPWTEAHLLPQFSDGLFGDLLYEGKPQILNGFNLSSNDTAQEHLDGMTSIACTPSYEHGEPVNMAFFLRRGYEPFTESDLETLFINANLIGRAASNLLLAQQLRDAYGKLDHQMQQVGIVQRNLLPQVLPAIDGLELAASYATCNRAGGDYYDVLALDDHRWGFFLADVSGHGVAAAVVMAMLHTLLHAYPGLAFPPGKVLAHINEHLMRVSSHEMFVTAFYGIYDTATRCLQYACAGHPPPRLRREREILELAEVGGLPLNVLANETWPEAEVRIGPGDILVLYTDGLIEGTNQLGQAFGLSRLDDAIRQGPMRAKPLVRHIECILRDYCGGSPELDDRTLVALVGVP